MRDGDTQATLTLSYDLTDFDRSISTSRRVPDTPVVLKQPRIDQFRLTW